MYVCYVLPKVVVSGLPRNGVTLLRPHVLHLYSYTPQAVAAAARDALKRSTTSPLARKSLKHLQPLLLSVPHSTGRGSRGQGCPETEHNLTPHTAACVSSHSRFHETLHLSHTSG